MHALATSHTSPVCIPQIWFAQNQSVKTIFVVVIITVNAIVAMVD